MAVQGYCSNILPRARPAPALGNFGGGRTMACGSIARQSCGHPRCGNDPK